jgi:hypothetical protein
MMVHRGIGWGFLKVAFATIWVYQEYGVDLRETNLARVYASRAVSLWSHEGFDQVRLGFLKREKMKVISR